MALWLTRGGKHGEHVSRFLETNAVYATWEGLKRDLSKLSWDDLKEAVNETFPAASEKRITNWSSQLWPFVHDMKAGDWVVMPHKNKPAIAIGEVTGGYAFKADAPDPYFHQRSVKWLDKEVPRSKFDQDLLYSFGAFMTICQIKRNDAEVRVRAMGAKGWAPSSAITPSPKTPVTSVAEDSAPKDLEQVAHDEIRRAVIAKFKGHGMERLVEAILKAQGYKTYRSPEGADKGVDILAAPGPLGFGQPRLCVQVKSQESPIDHPTLSQLLGTMQSVHADQGLLVSWGGFKNSVEKQTAAQFFRVRLWDEQELLSELLAYYDKLDPEIRAELPLKQIWTLVPDDVESP